MSDHLTPESFKAGFDLMCSKEALDAHNERQLMMLRGRRIVTRALEAKAINEETWALLMFNVEMNGGLVAGRETEALLRPFAEEIAKEDGQ